MKNISNPLNFTKHHQKWMLLCLVFMLIFFGAMNSLHAEIYKWRDNAGIIQYSNKPPEDPSLILEPIPTEKTPLIEHTDGVLYYLNVPTGNTSKNIAAPDPSNQIAIRLTEVEDLITELTAKNTSLEAIIRQQAKVLKAQDEQIKAIEAKLAQLQLPVQSKVISESQSSGIKIVERKVRRQPAGNPIIGWLKKQFKIKNRKES
jgi:hypothetical protein